MKGYKFSLNRVLDVRIIEEKIARNKLLQERQKARLIEDELAELNNSQQKLYEYLRKNELITEENLQARNYLYKQRGKRKDRSTQQLERVARSNQEFIEEEQKERCSGKIERKEYQKFYKELLQKENQ